LPDLIFSFLVDSPLYQPSLFLATADENAGELLVQLIYGVEKKVHYLIIPQQNKPPVDDNGNPMLE
jgi:hypothetical protein